MPRIVVVTSEMAGRVRLSRELARRLATAGHQPIVAGPVDGGDESFLHLPLGDEPKPGRHIGPGEIARALGVAEVTEALADHQPDLVMVDHELPVHVMAAWATGARVALWTSMLSVWKRPGLPPLHTPIVPGRGFAGSSLGIELAWARFRLGRTLGRLRRTVLPGRVDRVAVLEAVAADTGFPFDDHVSLHDWLLPVTFDGLPVLSFNLEELEFPHPPQGSVTYVGPLPDAAPAAPVEPALIELLERRRAGEIERLLYAGFGAWHRGDDGPFLRRVIEAVGANPAWHLVLGLGGRGHPEDFEPVPDNVLLLRWAPQRPVLGAADAAVHHGGIGSVNDCLTEGVPMVVYPFTFLDQPGNAARIEFHGLGEVGSRHEDDAADVAARIERVLVDPTPREAARRYAELVRRSDPRPLEEVERLLGSAPRRDHSG